MRDAVALSVCGLDCCVRTHNMHPCFGKTPRSLGSVVSAATHHTKTFN